MGRLWQILILSHWRAEFAWLPVETLIHFQQARYYQVLGQCDKASDCTAFVGFMLQNIIAALQEGLDKSVPVSEQMSEQMSEQTSDGLTDTAHQILVILRAEPELTAIKLAEQLAITPRTVERYLRLLQQKKKLLRVGPKKGGRWQVAG